MEKENTQEAQQSKNKELTPQEKALQDMGLMEKSPQPEIKFEPKAEDAKEPKEPKEPKAKKEVREQPAVKWEDITKGRIKSEQELEDLLTKYETYKDYEPLKQKYSDLEQEYTKLKSANPFAGNEPLYKVSKLAEELKRNDYGFLFNIVQSDFKEMSDLEVLKTKELLDNPEIYNGKEYLLDKGLIEQYNIQKPEDYEDLSEAEQKRIDDKVAINMIKMAKDAKSARQYLSDLQGKYTPENIDHEAVKKQGEEKLQNFVTQWKPTYQSLEKDFTKVTIETDGHTYDVPVRDEDKAIKEQVFKEAAAYLVAQGFEVNDANIKHLKDVIEDRYISLNKKYIFKKVGEISRDMADDVWRKKVNNPSSQRTDTQQHDVELTPEQIAINKLQGKN